MTRSSATADRRNRHVASPIGQVGLLHGVAIIDLTTGDQPMQGQSGDWITANHEIYNYVELREGWASIRSARLRTPR